MKRIGLIGGIGWVSTRDYYSVLNRHAASQRPSGSCDLVLRSLDFADILARAEAGEDLGATMVDAARDLAAAGASVVAICSGTGHLYADRVAKQAGVELVHIADAAAIGLKAAGVERIGLAGTRRMLDDGGFATRLSAAGIEVVLPSAESIAALDAAIFAELEHERVGAASRSALDGLQRDFVGRGVQDILLGCTELPFAVRAHPLRSRTWDAIELHCDALLDRARRSS